jgi:hypothetical protein
MITTNGKAVREAQNYFDSICTEPVRAEYLAMCKQEYRPPRLDGAESSEEAPVPPPRSRPKLRLIKLREFDVPKSEQAQFQQGCLLQKSGSKTKQGATLTASTGHASHEWQINWRPAIG